MKTLTLVAQAVLGLALIFAPFNLVGPQPGWPGLLAILGGVVALYKLRLQHTLAHRIGLATLAGIVLLSRWLPPGPILNNFWLSVIAGGALYAGRSCAPDECDCD